MKRYRPRLARRPRLHAFIVAGVGAGLGLLVFVLFLARGQLQQIDETQWSLSRKIQGITNDTRNVLRRLNEHHSPDCSDANLRLLRQEIFHSTHLGDLGVFDEQQRLVCTTVMGVLPRPVRLPPPDAIVRTPQGEEHALYFNLPLLVADMRVRAMVARSGRYNVVVIPLVLEELYAVEEGTLRVQRLDGSLQLAHADPATPPALLERLAQAQWFEQSWHGYSWRDRAFVSSRRIEGTPYVSQFVVPLTRFVQDHAQYLALGLVLSMLAGALLYAALLPVLRRWGELDHRIAGLLNARNILCLYQPIVEMRSGKPVGCEVLMRLRDGDDVLTPDRVLPVVARCGLWWALDEVVVRQGLGELCARLPASSDLKISFNFFPGNIQCQRLTALIGSARAQYPHHALRLDIEVTEQSEQGALAAEMAGLRRAGYQVSIDDFGTGYSNLSSVKALAPDTLKIDKSFVFEMEDASVRSSLIPEIVGIARAVGARVVAEGIENEAQRERLIAFGVDYGQGYLFARPMAIDAFMAWLEQAGALPRP
ncbi:EAL domain-containing protein [Rhodoferax sp. BAB1]|uniref:EAL domain-containing protein n=1 Tax=Rhodoferax sp. BAB1 TaxID=2741720 RepID=UPI00157631A9|nr:EAL domain-containing protein [Rhodoferax sp. BAB1]QKO21487.1 EAL domain-containing protein [Rhodoferax sp. BAB1]